MLPELKNWTTLNAGLREANEARCTTLLAAERAGLNRAQFLLRIYSRFNRVRATRERKALLR